MKKKSTISRQDLIEKAYTNKTVVCKGKKPDVRDRDELLKLIKAMKNK